jgi:cell wall assembly regulator SMI1
MRDVWTKIEVWLAANAPEVLHTLQPGASDEEIASTEAFVCVTFPEDVKDSYRTHNGQVPESERLMGYWELLSLDRIRFEWSCWKELLEDGAFEGRKSAPNGPIADDWWNPKWVPLTWDGCGNNQCLDMAPIQGGNIGQVITMLHDSTARTLVAPSFRIWLSEFANELESRQFIYSKEAGGLFKRGEL